MLGDVSAMRAGTAHAIAWWLDEIKSAYRDAAAWLQSLDRKRLTVEAGEHRWVLRGPERKLVEIDWQTAGADAARQRLSELARRSRRRGVVSVEIPAERTLNKSISLPASAEAQLDRILPFEIGRYFPFPAERVYYRYRILGHTGGSTGAPSISVEIVLVPRDVVTSIAAELSAAGLRLGGIALRSAGGALPIAVDKETARPGAPAAVRRRHAYAIAVMASIAAVSWPLAQQIRIAAMQHEITQLKPRAEAALREREQRQRTVEQENAFAQLYAARPPLIAVLDTMSLALPDGSWLTSLSISGRDVVLQGLSPSAATIALSLGHNGSFDHIAFRTPIAREAATGLERFQLGMTIEPSRQ
ncbi:MAG TPA: PilN domain-containing protein [Stellaceae bacterium]|nr:PilN domain-containing protein [Stellaceae bacterium]